MYTDFTSIEIAQILIGLFLSICMLQSGLDKALDWKGNRNFLQGHFSDTFLSSFTPLMLATVLVLELVGGLFCLLGVIDGLLSYDTTLIEVGLVIIGIDLVALFFGQRIAKDYEGAATLVGYFMLCMIGIITFGL